MTHFQSALFTSLLAIVAIAALQQSRPSNNDLLACAASIAIPLELRFVAYQEQNSAFLTDTCFIPMTRDLPKGEELSPVNSGPRSAEITASR
jgi:hypothetical protein